MTKGKQKDLHGKLRRKKSMKIEKKTWKSKKTTSIDSNLHICAGNEKENDYFLCWPLRDST